MCFVITKALESYIITFRKCLLFTDMQPKVNNMQSKLDVNTEDIKQLKLDLEVPKLVTAPENCGEAVKIGVKASRSITLDPDGQSVKEDPIHGFCEISTGRTILDNDVTVC